MIDVTTIMTIACADIKNYFLKDKVNPYTCIHKGTFTISSGIITPSDFLKEGQYFRICNSDLNDGVWLNTAAGRQKLVDEEFDGLIWAMSVPKSFVTLCEQIAAWADVNEAATSPNMSTLASESFGNYSYSKQSGSTSKSGVGGAATTWLTEYYDALTPYRREFVL